MDNIFEPYDSLGDVKYVISVNICNSSCPVCVGFEFYKLMKLTSFDDVLHFILNNLNYMHVGSMIGIDNDNIYKIEYGAASRHAYHSIEIKENDKIIARTCDNGSGKLIWDLK
jgi:hypothetical protein